MAKKYCATATLIILGALFLMGNNKSFAETSNNLKQH
jgi:hypothetical protein